MTGRSPRITTRGEHRRQAPQEELEEEATIRLERPLGDHGLETNGRPAWLRAIAPSWPETRPIGSAGPAFALQSRPVTDADRPLVLPGPFRAAIFDMDGLLLDTERLWVEAEAELLARHGDQFTEADHAATHGRAMAESVAIYAQRLGGLDPVMLEAELLDLMRAHYDSGAALQPGAEALVRSLEGRMRLGVASSTTAPLVRLGLERAGLLDAFEVVTSGADLGWAKPFPDAYLEALPRAGGPALRGDRVRGLSGRREGRGGGGHGGRRGAGQAGRGAIAAGGRRAPRGGVAGGRDRRPGLTWLWSISNGCSTIPARPPEIPAWPTPPTPSCTATATSRSWTGHQPRTTCVARAVELGLTGLAITDHQGLYGAVRFAGAAEAAGLHAVIGIEIELIDAAAPDPDGIAVPARRAWRPGRRLPVRSSPAGSEAPRPVEGLPGRPRPDRARLPGHRQVVKEDHRGIGEAERGPHLVLLARDATGWRSLCRMVSRANMAGSKAVPAFTHALLEANAEGLVALSGCRHGELARRLRAGDRDGARAVAERYARTFGRADDVARSGFVLELSHHLLPDDDWLASETARLASELALPVVVTNDVHYALPEGRELQDVITAIRHGRSLAELSDLRRPDGESCLKGAAGLLALPPGDGATAAADPVLARAWSEGIAASAEIAAACRVELAFERYRFPGFTVPSGETPFSHLSGLCWEGARRRYHPFTPAVMRQLAHELDVIEKTGLAEFFLICWDLMRFAKLRGIPAQGRGSAADSIVAYVLGITRVDPIRHELLFERFINEGRTAYPDVDIDFSSERREEVIQYVYGKYGPEHTGMVCNLVTYRARSAVREVGNALGFPAPAGGPGCEGARDVRQRHGAAGPRGRGRVRRVLRAARTGRSTMPCAARGGSWRRLRSRGGRFRGAGGRARAHGRDGAVEARARRAARGGPCGGARGRADGPPGGAAPAWSRRGRSRRGRSRRGRSAGSVETRRPGLRDSVGAFAPGATGGCAHHGRGRPRRARPRRLPARRAGFPLRRARRRHLRASIVQSSRMRGIGIRHEPRSVQSADSGAIGAVGGGYDEPRLVRGGRRATGGPAQAPDPANRPGGGPGDRPGAGRPRRPGPASRRWTRRGDAGARPRTPARPGEAPDPATALGTRPEAPFPRSAPPAATTTRVARATPPRASRGCGRAAARGYGTERWAPYREIGERSIDPESGVQGGPPRRIDAHHEASLERGPDRARTGDRPGAPPGLGGPASPTGSAGWSCAPASTASRATSRSTAAAC